MLAPVLDSERMCTVFGDLYRFEQQLGFGVLPRLRNVLDMFRMIMPQDVRVVIVAQSPYPGHCPNTGVPYACGPAFLPSRCCTTVPATLANVISEACRDFARLPTKSPQDMLLDWVDQGVMLLNSSLTLGVGCPKYLENHSIMWHEIMQDVVCAICKEVDPVFVLVGRDAYKLEDNLLPNTRIIKVSHPVARKETSTPWYGSGVFSRVSGMMVERGDMPIKWL